jgi:hypothetical protein
MADVKISALPASTTPLAGTEVLPIVQSGATKQVAVSDLTVGRNVSANSYIIPSQTVSGSAGYFFNYNPSQAASRSWSLTNDVSAYGDFVISQSTTQSGSSYGAKLYFGTTGGLSIGNSVDAGAGNLNVNGTLIKVGTTTTPSGGAVAAVLNNASGGGLQMTVGNNGGGLLSGTATGGMQFYTFTGAVGSETYSEKMRIAPSGGVSIGNTTDKGAGSLNVSGLIFPQQAASAPTYQKGAIYFDTTLNKLRVGGATGWETITSV